MGKSEVSYFCYKSYKSIDICLHNFNNYKSKLFKSKIKTTWSQYTQWPKLCGKWESVHIKEKLNHGKFPEL